jgi:hypothetical protein
MISPRLLLTVVTLATALPAALTGAEYRGMTAGWPVYANGYYAANYPASYGGAPAYYVARPAAPAGYAPRPTGTMYVPVRAAYANPSYFAAYGASPVAYRPVTTTGYAPASGGYASAVPASAYYAPVTANYAPTNSYAVTPAGMSSAGSEAAAYYGHPTTLNYVAPRTAYRTTYAPVPVYMYRPVTTYDPITAQPVTCLQATQSTCCQPQRSRSWFSWLHPSNWFGSSSGRGCGSAPAPTTSYCGAAASQCGQPYYPVQPVVPVTPTITLPPNAIPAMPSTTFPSTVIPTGPIPPAGTRIPPPPTGAAIPRPGTTFTPADAPPRLTPLPSTTSPPGGIFTPGGTFPPPPGSSAPSTTIPPGGSFPTSPGTFGTGTNYAPSVDPYTGSKLTPALGSPSDAPSTGPHHSVFGSGYKAQEQKSNQPATSAGSNVIRAPVLAPAMPPNVQTVPDIDESRTPRPTSSAPQLLNPRDKTAIGADNRWAVVPAVWPVKNVAAANEQTTAPVVPTAGRFAQPATPAAPSLHYDDRGWKSAAF